MATRTRRAQRRPDALTRQRIVTAAIELLDAGGEAALTFRTLAERLSTGAGAIYWHVGSKDELLATATDQLVGSAISTAPAPTDPRDAVRGTALAVFDAINDRPWVGAQLARQPWQPAVVHLLEAFGQRLPALGVPPTARFDAASALLNYVLGLVGQYAAAHRLLPPDTDRRAFLDAIAAQWAGLEAERFPFVRGIADQLPGHDDRTQFVAGIDLILGGLERIGPPAD